MTPKSQQNQQLTLPSTWSKEGLLSRLCDFSLGVSHPIPWPSPDSLSMDAMASFEVAQSPYRGWMKGIIQGLPLQVTTLFVRYSSIIQYGCTTSGNQPRIIHIIRFTVGPHEDLWFTTTFQRLTTSHLVLLGQHLVRGWPATLYPVILRLLGFWTAPHLVGKYHDPWRPY